MLRGFLKKLGRRAAGSYSGPHKPYQKRAAAKAERRFFKALTKKDSRNGTS